MVLLTLRARQHRVVVRHQDALRFRFLEQVAVDATDPRDHSVRGRVLHQVLDRAPPPLRRNHQRPVLDEGARVAQVLDIFASGTLPGLAPPRDRVGPRCVETQSVSLDYFRKIGTHAIQIDVRRLGALRRFDLPLLDKRQRMPLKDRVAFGNRDPPHDSAPVGRDDVLHLHRFHHEQLLPAMHPVAFAHIDRNDRALHRRLDRHRVFRRRDVVRLRCHDGCTRRDWRRPAALRFAVMEHRQRIARINLRARSTSA